MTGTGLKPNSSPPSGQDADDRVDGQGQYRSLHEVVLLVPEHRFGFRVFAEQAVVDQRRQILATLRGQFETVLDQIGVCHHFRLVLKRTVQRFVQTSCRRASRKKEQGAKPCSENCVDPISPKIRFDLD